MSEKKISCLRRGFSFTRPTSVRTEAVSRILHSNTELHKYENTEYRQYYLYTERQALTTNPRAAFGREGKLCLSHQSSAELMR